jgi:hypothetical protein
MFFAIAGHAEQLQISGPIRTALGQRDYVIDLVANKIEGHSAGRASILL